MNENHNYNDSITGLNDEEVDLRPIYDYPKEKHIKGYLLDRFYTVEEYNKLLETEKQFNSYERHII